MGTPMKRRTLLCLGALALTTACTSDDENRITEWQGAPLHLVIQGTLDGEDLDVDIRGNEAVAAAMLTCELEWVAPPTMPGGVDGDLSMARHREVKLLAQFEMAGETRYWSMEFKEHDFTGDNAGDTLDIIPRVETMLPGPSEVWVEAEWLDSFDGDEIFEQAASEGFLVTQGLTGTPGADGVVFMDGTSIASGFLEARWSAQEELAISFSIPCTLTDIDVEE